MKLLRYKKAVGILWYALAAALIGMTLYLKSGGICYLTFADRLKNDPWLTAYLLLFAAFAAVTVLSTSIERAAKKQRENAEKGE